ncbi:MAG: hypothetical protein Ta2E_01240 [Mycoplasmoidaceae bacterium]|nr:MAG: hypothetical protein Ta2E_01240 [Mycoplasmoidaceae bacterium]
MIQEIFCLRSLYDADGSHMEGLSSAGSDVTWIIEGTTKFKPFEGSGAHILKMLATVMLVFSAICDWN